KGLLRLTPLSSGVLLFLEFAACLCQCFFLLAEEARVSDELTVGESGELLKPYIHSDLLLGFGKRFSFDLAGEAGEPFAGLNAKCAGFDLALNGPVKDSLDVAYFGEVKPFVCEAYASVCAHLWIGQAVVLPASFETGIARVLACFDAPEEGIKGEVNANR